MSCEQNRHKFFQIMAGSGALTADEFEHLYQQNRRVPGSNAERMAAGAKTRMLFQMISNCGLKPPTHAADGMPKAESQPGYAAVYDLLKKHGLLGEHAELRKIGSVKALYAPGDPALGLDGRDAEGYDRWGYNKEGFDRGGYDREGFNKDGWNRQGVNRQRLDAYMIDKNGFGVDGYNRSGIDANGVDRFGYFSVNNRDADSYDRDGYDQDGYDREGYNARGIDRDGKPDPDFMPDTKGYYPDGLNEFGYDTDGYDLHGNDRWGFGRDGYNFQGYDRNGYDRQGVLHHRLLDAEGFDASGYSRTKGSQIVDRTGYDVWGMKNGRSFTGFDRDMKDATGQPRKMLNAKGRLVNARYDPQGFDENGYDQRGYHRDLGLTAPDEKGRRYNTFGWVYDESTGECFDPADPARRVRNEFKLLVFARRSKRQYVVSSPYIPPAPPPPLEPQDFMAYDKYDILNGRSYDYVGSDAHLYATYTERLNMKPSVGWRRGALHTKVKNGILMRCPHCGRFTNGGAHDCPSFDGHGPVRATHAGVVLNERGRILMTPHNPDYDPEYDLHGGYNSMGLDRDGYDRFGYNARGFNREGYDRVGYDVFGYDRDGYDRNGYNNMGVNRRGEKRGSSLKDIQELVGEEGRDLLANEDLARMYGQIATGLIGKPRQVILREGGFSTDMRGKIYADPYPLGRGADPRHNLIVTRAGIYHELGHEQFTPQGIWGRVLEVAEGKQDEGLGEAARKMVPRFYNIVEDGRMEREVSRTYKGAAEILAASCRLEPRWGEEVGNGVSDSDQVFWALLYTGLPYYRVRPAVREGMTPRARKVFEELEPLVARAVRGTPEDAYQAAIHVAKRFEEEGFITLPPKDSSNPMPKPPPGSGQSQPSSSGQQGGQGQSMSGAEGQSASNSHGSEQSSSGGSSGHRKKQDEEQGAKRGTSGGTQEEEKKGRRRKAQPDDDHSGAGRRGKKPEEQDGSSGKSASGGAQDEKDSSGAGGGGQGAASGGSQSQSSSAADKSDEFLFGNEVVDAAMRSVEKDAASVLENGVRARSKANTIGKPLHNPLPDTSAVSQRYRDVNGLPQNVFVSLPKGNHTDELQDRRGRHKEVAAMMTKPLKAIREQAEQRLRRQSQGRLDRRQLVNAYKGMDDVYAEIKKKPQTSFSASVMVDLSGSMHNNVTSRQLYDSVMTLGDCFDMLDMPFEVRAFGSSNAQVKALNESFDVKRAAYLAEGDMGGTRLSETAGLAHSALLASEETNKMMVCLSDGALDDHKKTVRTLREARRNGVVTFGIFLGRNFNQNKLDELYGRGNWTAIQTLGDMPKSVAQRLASIFKSMR